MKPKRKKKKFTQTELQGLFKIKWKLTHGPPLNHDNTKQWGESMFTVPISKDPAEEFLKTYNIAGRKFKVLSVTEIQKGGSPPSGKKTSNQEHEDWDKIPI